MAAALPSVTVIVPTYNRADYLRETLDSLLAQDYPRLKVIVVDDGSTDDTSALLASYGDRIRVERQANAGEASAVNRGFALATGELIAVVSSDDPVLPGWLAAMVEAMQAQPELLAAYPDWMKVDADSRPTGAPFQRDYHYARMLRENICLPGPGAVIRRSALSFVHGRDPRFRFVGDFDFWLRLGLHGQLARVPRTLATFRVHGGSASENSRGLQMAAENVQVIERLFAQDSLPAQVRALERTSMATACYRAGALAMRENATAAQGYFARSLRLEWWHPQRIVYALAALLPLSIFRRLYRLTKAL